jgi:hypothetical protein
MDRGQEGPVKPAAAHGRLTDYAIPAWHMSHSHEGPSVEKRW